MDITTPDWVKDAVFYQIFPDRFAKSYAFGQNNYPLKPSNLQAWGATPTYHGFQGGDLLGAAEKLDYLTELGINAIYFNPIFSSAANHRYHTHDYFQVDPILGGNHAFERFLREAHERGIRVILDGVFNHASRGFFQFNHLLECGSESPYTDWFHVHNWPVNAYCSDQPNYHAWWGIPSLPKFNTDSPAVREFLWAVATYWLGKGIDGWRLDVPNEIDDDDFWREFRRRCKAVNPEAYIVAELWGESKRWLQGDQFDAQMNYLFNRSAFGYFLGDNMDQTDTVRCGYGHIATRNGHEFAHDLHHMFNELYEPEVVFAQMNMLGSHDTPRTMTVAREDATAVNLMYLCAMTVPGAPNIYYGDEIGMIGRHDPDCRRAFPWDNEEAWNHELLDNIRAYIALRHEKPALRRGDFSILHATDKAVVYQRRHEEQTAVIAFNIGAETEMITCPEDFPNQLPEVLAKPGKAELFTAGKTLRIKGRNGRIWIN